MERKQAIRKELLKKRNSLTEENCKKYSNIIAETLFSMKQYIQADAILIYVSYQSEVSTYTIIENALNTSKRVFCPKVLSPGIMEFYEIFSFEDVVCGYKNIPEPKQGNSVFSFSDSHIVNSLMIMPLVGFDENKNRLGYGGGFYDRYLQRFPQLKRIGLAFDCQRCNSVPTEGTDQKLDSIITENRMF